MIRRIMGKNNGENKMKIRYIILIALIMILACTPSVSAIVAEYDISADASGPALNLYHNQLFNVTVLEIQNMTALISISHDSTYLARVGSGATGAGTASWPSAASAPFTASISDATGLHEIGAGMISSTFVSNTSPEIAFYETTVIFSSWDVIGVTSSLINLTYDGFAFGLTPTYSNWPNVPPNKASNYNTSAFLVIRQQPTNPSYGVIKGMTPGSIRTAYSYSPLVTLTLSVSETGNFAKKLSNVSILLSDGTSGTTNVNGTVTLRFIPGDYNFAASKEGYATIFSSLGGYGQTGGLLYLTMSPYIGGIPAGYTQTTVHAIDGVTGNHIPGSTINTKCVTNGTWKNETTSNGISYVTCPSADTIDIYGSLPGTYTASLELGAVQGGDYYLPLYPPVPEAPIGFINLFVYLREAGTGFIIKNAAVTIRLPSGATSGQNTGTSGTAQFTVPNQTVIIISSNPAGYNGQSISKTMGTVDYQVTITLSRATTPTGVITPVTTDPITGDVITTAATLDIRTDREKDTDMFGQIRIAGPGLIDLGIVAIVFGLLGFIMKFTGSK